MTQNKKSQAKRRSKFMVVGKLNGSRIYWGGGEVYWTLEEYRCHIYTNKSFADKAFATAKVTKAGVQKLKVDSVELLELESPKQV